MTQATDTADELLALRGVAMRYALRRGWSARLSREPTRAVHALDGIDLVVRPGEVVGIVGESGCGKSTLGRIAAGLVAPTEGRVAYRGTDLSALDAAARRRAHCRVQMIFQDPSGSLNPRLRIAQAIGQAPVYHGLVAAADRERAVAELMHRCGLHPSYGARYPHQLSTGQRQRAAIARALAVQPELVICDEVVASLDVSIQAQIINLFLELRRDLRLTYLFISHDLGVVRHIADRVVIMYLGRIVESGPAASVFARPLHPYTAALLAAIPKLEVGKAKREAVRGEVPSALAPPAGCHFHPRCPLATERCRSERPAMREIAAARAVACHAWQGVADDPQVMR